MRCSPAHKISQLVGGVGLESGRLPAPSGRWSQRKEGADEEDVVAVGGTEEEWRAREGVVSSKLV